MLFHNIKIRDIHDMFLLFCDILTQWIRKQLADLALINILMTIFHNQFYL